MAAIEEDMPRTNDHLHCPSPTPWSEDDNVTGREPTLLDRLLGIELRRVREAAGMTVREAAARLQYPPQRLMLAEDGVVTPLPLAPAAHRPARSSEAATETASASRTVSFDWGAGAQRVLTVLHRNAERVEIYAPFGVHPSMGEPDAERCTAYVLRCARTSHTGCTVRTLPAAEPHPAVMHSSLAYFQVSEDFAVVLHPKLHGALFTDDPREVEQARSLFDRLAAFTRRAEGAGIACRT